MRPVVFGLATGASSGSWAKDSEDNVYISITRSAKNDLSCVSFCCCLNSIWFICLNLNLFTNCLDVFFFILIVKWICLVFVFRFCFMFSVAPVDIYVSCTDIFAGLPYTQCIHTHICICIKFAFFIFATNSSMLLAVFFVGMLRGVRAHVPLANTLNCLRISINIHRFSIHNDFLTFL